LAAPSGTLGQLTIASGGYVRSSNYSAGTAGWQLGQTAAELNNVIVRGTLDAPSGTLGTITAGVITNTGGTSIIDLNATGVNPLVRLRGQSHTTAIFSLQGNGHLRIGGTSRYIQFDGADLTLNDVNLVAPRGTLGQLQIAFGGHIRSSNYSAGSAGWQLGQTSAELNNVTLRGTLAAPSGTLGQLTIASGGYIQSSDYVPGTSGWRLDNNGVEANNGIFRGRIDGSLVTTRGIQFA